MKKLLITAFFIILAQLLLAQYPSCFSIIPQSPKPEFITYLKGVKSWHNGFIIYNGEDMTNKTTGNFGMAYVLKEVERYLKTIIPDAEPNTIHYDNESTTQLIIDYSITANHYITGSGNWKWNIICMIDFRSASNSYKYSYKISKLNVMGGDFGNHSLYNVLLNDITSQTIHHNKSQETHLGKILTDWDETALKDSYNTELHLSIEGIYEEMKTGVQDGHNLIVNQYKLGVKYIDGIIYIIYLNGANMFDDWEEGELKAILEPTATPYLYKTKWIGAFKDYMDGYISFEQNLMKSVLNGEQTSYLKLYPSVMEKAPESTVWSGTGFALKNGYIITNNHVIDDAKTIIIKGINGEFNSEYSANVIAIDKHNDLALLKIADDNFSGLGNIPYKIKASISDVGESVFVLGYPLTSTMGNEIKLTSGIISSKTGFQGDVSLYQISAPIQPGNSGGPLFDDNGNIIGVVNAKHLDAENVGYAIKTSYLVNLVESAVSSNIIPSNNTLSGQPLTEKVKKVKDFIYLIVCTNAETQTAVNNNYVQKPTVTPLINDTILSNTIIIDTIADRTIQNPSVSNNISDLTINSIIITDDYTAIEIKSKYTHYQWCRIDKETYISCDDKVYSLIKTENINIAPKRTYYHNKDITFTLYFQPIPKNAHIINLIEPGDSNWRFYGINLK